MARHTRFLSRTVMVVNNDVDAAMGALNKILSREGILKEVRLRSLGYEKPYMMRQRVSVERCLRINRAEMKRKIEMVSIKERRNPWPR